MIHLSNITKQHGNQLLFRDASFQILPGSRTGLVGPNGAGKTTIFRIITGEEEVDAGEITCAKRTSIGYFSQDVGEMAGRTALEEVMAVSAETVRLAAELKEMVAAMAEPMDDDAMAALLERYGTAMEEFEHRGGYDLDTRARTILTGLGIGPDRYDHPVESFSGGWKMRIALAGILTLQPDVLLLDEPTNHLDVESIIWLEEWLAGEFTGALLMTSHDRDFMNRIVTRIIEWPIRPSPPTAAITISTSGSGTSAASSCWPATSGSRRCWPRKRSSLPASRPGHPMRPRSSHG